MEEVIEYICGDLVTLKTDNILRVVRYQNYNMVWMNWFDDEIREFQTLCISKEQVVLVEKRII